MFWFDLSALLKQPLIATKPPNTCKWEWDLFSASRRKQIIVQLFKRVPDLEYYK